MTSSAALWGTMPRRGGHLQQRADEARERARSRSPRGGSIVESLGERLDEMSFELLTDWSWGAMSGKRLQVLARAAFRCGARGGHSSF